MALSDLEAEIQLESEERGKENSKYRDGRKGTRGSVCERYGGDGDAMYSHAPTCRGRGIV
jgi:hypothetical protein